MSAARSFGKGFIDGLASAALLGAAIGTFVICMIAGLLVLHIADRASSHLWQWLFS